MCTLSVMREADVVLGQIQVQCMRTRKCFSIGCAK